MSKQQLIELGQKVGLTYVCKEYSNKWKQDIFVFQVQPDKRVYEFAVYNFLAEDLAEKNMALCLKSGVSREA